MLVDNRLTSPVRNGTVLGIGMMRYDYVYMTQMAELIPYRFDYKNGNKFLKNHYNNEWKIMVVSYNGSFNELA